MRGTLVIDDADGTAVEWQPGEHLTVEVIARGDTHLYQVETVETVPADIRQRHAAEIVYLTAVHAAQLEGLQATFVAGPGPSATEPPF